MSDFLTLDQVLLIHDYQIEHYGGSSGIRDVGLLHSALATPEATFDGTLLHGDLWEQAAAYLFHLCKNHPFVDGNKRVALHTALAFLKVNGYDLRADEDVLSDLVIGVAEGRVTKSEVAVFLMQHSNNK